MYYPPGFDICELDEELIQNRIEAGLEKEDYDGDEGDKFSFAARTARTAKRDADIDNLLKRYSPSDVEYILEPLGVRPCHIQARVAKLGLERKSSDIDIITGEAFVTGGYVGIIQP
jgi:hypothetical protein